MSYNTRRSTTGFGTPQQAQQASSVGQRRPAVTNNFVAGGQLAGSQQQQQQKPQGQVQQQQQRTPQQQQQTSATFRSQPQQQPQQQSYQTQSYASSTPQQAANKMQGRYVQGQQTPLVKQEPAAVKQQATPKPAVVQNVAPIVPGANPPPPELDDGMDTSADGSIKKKFWNKGNGNKISRSEKVRRRNLKLSKLLQPKNAVMILNELVKGCVYNVEDLPVKVDANQFRGTVVFDGQEFAGTGRTKNGAKNAAAETALKHLVKNKQIGGIKKEEDGDEKMDIGDDESGQVMPWSHIASFAMYKLFSTWGEDPSLVNRIGAQEIMAGNSNASTGPRDPKPARKMPENPESVNPLMLMHQMLPNAIWEEVGKSGNPPNVMFTFALTVEGKKFSGTGTSKKGAKKLAAYSACHELLNINYPADVWSPMF